MYTSSLLLKITDLIERGAVTEILGSLSKLKEKNRLRSGASLSIKADSSRLTANAQKFLAVNLKQGFNVVDLRFENSSIIATITPK